MKKVAIQGQVASFHHVAAQKFLGEDIEIVSCETFKDTFAHLVDGDSDYAVVAIENSLYGSINEVYDLLLKHKSWIVGEVFLRIEHCLIGVPNANVGKIAEVHSHPVALAQCEEYLDTTLAHAERFEHHDTAGSVADVKKWNDPTKAAIASREAAKLHGLEVLAENIETHRENYTRFVVLQKKANGLKDPNKTSLVLTTMADTKPGALYKALGAFAKRDINLTMLHSRPIIGTAWHYLFYMDLGVGYQQSAFKDALKELEELGFKVTILGSYQAAR